MIAAKPRPREIQRTGLPFTAATMKSTSVASCATDPGRNARIQAPTRGRSRAGLREGSRLPTGMCSTPGISDLTHVLGQLHSGEIRVQEPDQFFSEREKPVEVLHRLKIHG